MMWWMNGVARTLVAATVAALLVAGRRDARSTNDRNDRSTPPGRAGGRMIVTVDAADGSTHDFVLGLATPVLTESGAALLGADRSTLSLGGVSVRIDGAQEVPDSYLGGSGAVGVLGGATLNGHDILIDVPSGRLLLKPVGRSVRWSEMALSGPVAIQVYHDVLLRADIELGGKLAGGLLDLSQPHLQVNEPLGGGVAGGSADSFRMGYGSWTDVPARVVDSPVLTGWDREGTGFAILGAAVAYDCAIAISWYHREMRTCLR